MENTLRLYNNGKICLKKYNGDVTRQELDDVKSELDKLDSEKKIEILISDFTDATLQALYMNDVKSLAIDAETIIPSHDYKLIIGIAPNDLEAGFSKLLQAYTKELNLKSLVVKTASEAEAAISEHIGEKFNF